MTKEQLKLEVEKLAKDFNMTFVEACQAMQGSAAKLGNESVIQTLHDLKMESL